MFVVADAAGRDEPRPVRGDDLQHQWAHGGQDAGARDHDDGDGDHDEEYPDDVVGDVEVVITEIGVTEAEVLDNVPVADRAEVEQLAERVRRHAVDAEVFAAVRAEGFEGKRWDRLAEDLGRYGWAVMAAWLFTGYVFVKVNQIGRPLTPTDAELAELARDAEVREELCIETVARAVKTFRDQAIADRGWSPQGGANLTTFFVGACVQAFNNEFRRWCRLERRWGPNQVADPQVLAEHGGRLAEVSRGPHVFAEPARAAADGDHFERVLTELSDTEQVIVRFTDAGYAQKEIGEMLGLTERAVEARLYRLRRRDIRGAMRRHGDG